MDEGGFSRRSVAQHGSRGRAEVVPPSRRKTPWFQNDAEKCQSVPVIVQQLIPELVFQVLKQYKLPWTLLLDMSWFMDGPNLQNQAKTLYCLPKSRVPAASQETRTFLKQVQKWRRKRPRKAPEAKQSVTGTAKISGRSGSCQEHRKKPPIQWQDLRK